MTQKTKLIVLFFLGIGLTGLQAQNMYVKEINGTQTVYALNSLQKLTFSSGNLIVAKTDNTQGVYARSTLRYLGFYNFPVSIQEQENDEKMSLLAYPNPVSNELTIDLSGMKSLNGTLRILNIEGKVMKTKVVSSSNIVMFDMSQLPMGFYFCQYNNGIEIKTVEIIKQ
ncbi:MAG: T9SS type A sorting domain-containing protein [Bacteroidales bacterium]|nr:T9SS type A sorting domain-containing protein [Bacteroidales bacterium]MDY0216107.1 T9SS type A sorting domain-containing protein [Bacteroidales bacterium]